MIYLDNAATTRLDPSVFEAMLPYLSEEYGNPGSLHTMGRTAAKAVETARAQVAEFLHCSPEQIIFTSGGTEANAMVFEGLKDRLRADGKTHIITSEIEHTSVLRAAEALIKDGFDVTFLRPDSHGVITAEDIFKAITPKTGLVSIMYENNEIGSINPVGEIAIECWRHGALFHTDCVQAAAGRVINAKDIGCDFLSVSSHKLHGPKGMGVLFVKNKNLLSPILRGGDSQEYGLRGGTENVPGIVGTGAACSIMGKRFRDDSVTSSTMKQVYYLRLMGGLEDYGYESCIKVNGPSVMQPGKILSLTIHGVDGQTLLLLLASRGVCVSAGSACRGGENSPSPVLTSIGVGEEDARCTIRVSFSRMNAEHDVILAADCTAKCIAALLEAGRET